jgi:hypothetical protein
MRFALVAALMSLGCSSGDPEASCKSATRCQEFYDYTREELDVANNACTLGMGSWSTDQRCVGAGTVGTCRIVYMGDPGAHSITWYQASTYTQASAMTECTNANGNFTATQ